MVKSGASAGFTLIELTLVMAITGLLAIGILSNQSSLIRRVQFDTGVDYSRGILTRVRGEALESVNPESTCQGNDSVPGCNLYVQVQGRLVEFTENSDEIRVYTLKNNINGGPNFAIDQVTDNQVKFDTFQIPWKTVYKSDPGLTDNQKECARYVAFVRNADGVLLSYTFNPVGYNDAPCQPLDPAVPSGTAVVKKNYNQVGAFRQDSLYHFESADGSLKAAIKVEGTSNAIYRVPS